MPGVIRSRDAVRLNDPALWGIDLKIGDYEFGLFLFSIKVRFPPKTNDLTIGRREIWPISIDFTVKIVMHSY